MAKKDVPSTITRKELVELLNQDLEREYQAIIAYVNYSQVLKGAQYISPSILSETEGIGVEANQPYAPQGELTDRQREVLKLLAEGRTMKEIAYILILTPRTVAFHKYKIMERFRLRTNADLIQFAIQERVVEPRL